MQVRRKGSRNCANRQVRTDILTKFRTQLETLSPTKRNNYLRTEVFKKFVSSETDPADVRRQRAINKWLSTESTNLSTNERLLSLDPGFNIIPGVEWRSFRAFCQDYLIRILGELPPADVTFGTFSGGASTSRMRALAHPALKFVGKAHVTEDAVELATVLLVESRAWAHYGNVSIDVVPGNVLFTVPKTAEIDRCAAKEPDLNMFMQKGVGDFIRLCLRRFGINLNDQSRNRHLALEGSINGSLATLDLSSASDSISTMLVFELLPIHWYSLLDRLRSKVTSIDGIEHTNEMFSSMGNGFTFELESLLFFVICKAVSYFEGISGIISVYGDDLIVPTGMFTTLTYVLSVLGFEVNPLKSFNTGTFRESCGGHYDDGRDVTPFYVRRDVSTISDLIHLLNQIWNWSYRAELGVLDPELMTFWSWAKDFVPRQLWGGQDVTSITSLVTGDLPRRKLKEIYQQKKVGIGGFIFALRAESSVRGSFRSISTNRYSIVSNQELVNTDVTRALLLQ